MNIIFSDHALLKMEQRKLSKRMVESVVENPDRSAYAHSGRTILYKKFRTRSLKVVIVRERDAIIVVTTHWVA